MRRHFLASLSVVTIATAIGSLMASVSGQTQPAKALINTTGQTKTWTLPRTVDDQPDLQGVWSFATMAPLERPPEFVGKEFLTDEELAEVRKKDESYIDFASNGGKGNSTGSYNKWWFEPGPSSRRTSLIVDPHDGRLPPLTSQGQKRLDDKREAMERSAGPEDRSATDRCILGFTAGPPMMPDLYNSTVQVFQTHDYFVIYNEMVHNARIVPLDRGAHGVLRQWSGDSRGHWEGDTMIIDTINLTDEGTGTQRLAPTLDQNTHLIERFRRTGPETLDYEFTVDDPTIWTRPWTARIPWAKMQSQLYEYACHEGNYSMAHILSGARARDQAVADAGKKGRR